MKIISVVIDSKNKNQIYKLLDKEIKLKLAFDKSVDILKRNPYSGKKVKRSLWPKKLIKEYQIDNLYRYDMIRKHPGWRLLYTLQGDSKVKILVVVLDVLEHKKYDRLFKY